jgi:tRNA(fMet)-specific endonuclease VapC
VGLNLAYLVDTNIAIYASEGVEPVLERFIEHEGMILLSALSLAGLQRGLYLDPGLTLLRQERLETLLLVVSVLPFDARAAEAYGRIIMQIGRRKKLDFDRMLAAHAIVSESVLVTANVADFADVPGLTIENWAARR